MSLYFFSLIILIIVVFISSLFVYSRYKKSSGIFFLLFSMSISAWFLLYFLSFSTGLGSDTILKIYRFQYSLSVVGFYSIVAFLALFAQTKKSIQKYKKNIFIVFGIIFLIVNASPFILKGVVYDNEIGSYAEVYGVLYPIIVFLYALIFPLFGYISYRKLQKLGNLDKVRMLFIIFGFIAFIFSSLSVTVFIPFLANDSSQLYFERALPFFMLPFIAGVLYSSQKYDFSGSKIYTRNIIITLASIFCSASLIFMIQLILGNLGNTFGSFLNIRSTMTWIDVFLGIILYIFFHSIFTRHLKEDRFDLQLKKAQEQIPFINDFQNLNIFLKKYFLDTLEIKNMFITDEYTSYPNISQYFSENIHVNFLIDDFVFFEKNKHKLNVKNILEEIPKGTFLIFPLRKNDGELRGIVAIGKKKILNAYTTQEIQSLHRFSKFLAGHLKYLDTYKQIQDLNFTLDKRVDQKTIEYNNLISRQKEFIAYVGHEIRNPVTNTIFMCDDINSSVGELKSSKQIKIIQDDLQILYSELTKLADLSKSIFSVEKHDLEKVKLYKKQVHLYNFLYNEGVAIAKVSPNIVFNMQLDQVGEYDIDEVQFREVIHNLLANALKYVSKQDGKVELGLSKKDDNIIIKIQDNGQGLSDIDISNIFDKYATGNNDSIGLGMGLYLCKRIVELHGGTIKAGNSKKLGGACFTIKL